MPVPVESVQPPQTPSPLETLRNRLGLDIPHVVAARKAAQQKKIDIGNAIDSIDFPESASFVVFGSLARGEWTSGSDVDWTLLVDGPADPQHFSIVSRITEQLKNADLVQPGASGTFASLASSHELVHHIGGNSDSNANMTRRTLLLLESESIGAKTVRRRVVRAILNRYIVCGPGVGESSDDGFRCPRFLLNDVVRLWRTFAVDYAAKKWQQSDEKWAIRNAKLRIPRKLTFVKGLLLCVDCELFSEWDPWIQNSEGDELREDDVREARLLEGCFFLSELSPLDAVARVCNQLKCDGLANEVFKSYDAYLALIDDQKKREHLERSVIFGRAREDSVFREVRKISHDFGNAVEQLFFEQNETLTKLTRKYGVF